MDKTFNSWGKALCCQAMTKESEEANRLFEDAYKKFERALRIKKDFYQALHDWGMTIGEQAKIKSGSEADELFAEAYRKLQEALKIKTDYYEALNNWGCLLLSQATTKTGEERELILAESLEKCNEAESVKAGSGSYNIACIFALREEPEKCKDWFHKSRKNDFLPTCEHLKQDSDLDSLRELEWFKDFLQEVCGGEEVSGDDQ